eukprot:SAG22_NODE_2865_length_2143_cov_2.261252_1_plen_200_part_10
MARPLAALCALTLAAPVRATRETLRFDFGTLSRAPLPPSLCSASTSLLCSAACMCSRRWRSASSARSAFSVALLCSAPALLTARHCPRSLAPPARRWRLWPRAVPAAALRAAHAEVPGEAQERLHEPAGDLLRPAEARDQRVERGRLPARVLLGRELPDLPVGAGRELVGARRRLLGGQVRRRPAREHDVGRRHALPARQ